MSLSIDDPRVRQPDITRARQLLGWEPEVELEQGLRRMPGIEAAAGAR
jgi:dTDP-glucose 4,6-dehydratase